MEADGVTCVEEAMDTLRIASFDLALVDIGLPGKSGLELLSDIREEFPYLPVIVITGNPTLKAARKAIQLGARDFFQKPLFGPEIIGSIRTIVKGARNERARTRTRELAMGNRMTVNLCNHFNNLLGAIIGHSSMLVEKPEVPRSIQTEFEEVAQQGRKISDLVRRMSLFCQTDVQLDNDIKPIALLRDSVDACRTKFHRKIAGPAQEADVRLDCNAHRLASLYHEMISFVCASSDAECEVTVQANVDASGLQPELTIQVEAEGTALPPFSPEDVLAPLQESWEKLSDNRLGIAVAHAIAIQMDGSLRVQNGSCPDSALCLTFPVQRISETVVKPPLMRDIGPAKGAVLIVDDNPSVMRLTCGMVKKLTGGDAYGVASGEDAITFLNTPGQEIGMVLMDIILEEESGFDVYRTIRRTFPYLPIVFISGYAGDQRISRTLNADPRTAFLPKPFDVAQLRNVLDTHALSAS